MKKPLVLLTVMLPALVFAQTAALPYDDLSRGLQLPPTSAAFVDDATAPNVNPAGLSHVGGAELVYLHERSIARNQVNDGAYAAGTFFHALSLSLSMEWLRSTTLPDVRKTTWGMALGGNALSLGLAVNF